jgi:NAD-dependent deacetylase
VSSELGAFSAELLRALARLRSAGVITGAGISAESGIPTYRGKGGIYDDPEEGDRTIESLSGETFERDPDRTWCTIADLARRARAARPNPAHHALVLIEQRVERFVLLTQNVDGLHQLAGSSNVIDIHGDVFATVCTSCAAHGRLERLDDLTSSPLCAACGGILRPDVVLFGEMLPQGKYLRVHAELLMRPPDLVLIAGTSALFPYIVEPVVHARRLGRLTIEVNPEETELSHVVDYSIRARAGEALPALADAIGTAQMP